MTSQPNPDGPRPHVTCMGGGTPANTAGVAPAVQAPCEGPSATRGAAGGRPEGVPTPALSDKPPAAHGGHSPPNSNDHGPATAQDHATQAPGFATARLKRISQQDALDLYRQLSIQDLGRMAFEACEQLHPEPYRTYAVDRNINYSNICTSFCTFCNFKVPPGDARGYVLTHDQVGRKIQELVDIGGTQTLMQGGIVPIETLPLEWYLDLLRFIRAHWPQIHIHAFSPPEIWSLHEKKSMPLRDLLLRLQEAGLATIPGGGAEILVDRVRRKISPKKCTADQWLEVMRVAHSIGMRTTATMMFGHMETVPERIEHFDRIRRLQDETGGFTAFILWPFQPDNTPLARIPRSDPIPGGEPDGEHLHLAGAHEYLRMLAMARIYLDNVPNLQSSWVTMGPKIGQLALFFGANDLGSVMMEENVVSSAGTTYRLDEAMIRRLIGEAGWEPKKRDCYYNPLE